MINGGKIFRENQDLTFDIAALYFTGTLHPERFFVRMCQLYSNTQYHSYTDRADTRCWPIIELMLGQRRR